MPALFAICRDPRLWVHFPSLRHTEPGQTDTLVQRWIIGWATHGLDTWVLRESESEEVIGYGGCSVLGGQVWNLGYRLAFTAQGRGYATEVAQAARACARQHRADLPVIAYLVEHNSASAHVAEKAGLTLVHRAPDAGNPDPAVQRLVFSDRPLDEAQVAATLA